MMEEIGDYLVRATAARGTIRAIAARTTALVEETRKRHALSPTATAALGRLLTAGAMLGALLKEKETVTLRIIGDGPVGGLIVDATPNGEVRGYVKNPNVDIPLSDLEKFDVAAAVGRSGFLYVTYDFELKEPYTGSAPLVSGEIARDLAYYFTTSEQIPSVVALGVLVGKEGVMGAGGLLLQLMPPPFSKERTVSLLEERLQSFPELSKSIYAGKSPEHLLSLLLEDLDLKVYNTQPLSFCCRCSREKVKEILVSLGRDEILSLMEREGRAEASCHFCSTTYLLSRAELASLLAQA